jgi:hypothetical protein
VDIATWGNNEDYLANLNIQYTNVAWIDIDWKDGSKNHDIPLAYGDATITGDLPTTGTKRYDLDDVTANMEIYTTSSNSVKVLSSGEGTITVNFDTKKVTGSITLNKFYEYEAWLQGGGCSGAAELFGLGTFSAAVDGSISGGDIDATLIINEVSAADGEVTAGEGRMLATLFGPAGGELGTTFYIYEDEDLDENSGVYWWDFFGAGYGD